MEGTTSRSLGVNSEEEEAGDQYEIASSAVDHMPPGFRFHPTDWEIIDYLLSKVIDRYFRPVAIGDIDLNNCEPWDLPKKAQMKGENEWFFYFEKITKYPSGMRTNRATPSGYWKATGKDKEIYNNKRQLVGMKKTLVFYLGRAPKGEKMNWVIHEYRLHGDFSAYNLSNDAKEKWVVCRVFHKKNGVNTDPSAQLGRIDSFVDHCLLDSPTPLPPLTDYSSHTDEKPTFSTQEADDQFKATTSMLKSQEILDQNSFFLPKLIANTYNQYSTPHNLMNPNNYPNHSTQMVHLNSVQYPHQSVPNLAYQHQDGLSSTTVHQKTNSRILAADDIYIGGKEPAERVMCKMEMAAELDCIKLESESKTINQYDVDEGGLCFSPNISDLDSFWSC